MLLFTPALAADSTFVQSQKTFASDGEAIDQFGDAVDIDGDVLVVGCRLADGGVGNAAGSAYVFERSAGVWSQKKKILPSDLQLFDEYGIDVGVSGSVIVVGANREDTIADNAGAAYVFEKITGQWQQTKKLMTDEGQVEDLYCEAVDVDDETIVIGAFSFDDTGPGGFGQGNGAAFVYVKQSGDWVLQQKLLADDGANNDFFGRNVAISGDTIVIGATGDDPAGSAYVFDRVDGVWSQSQKLIADDGATGDAFGRCDIDGDTIVIGAIQDGDAGAFSGSAYVYERNAGVWQQVKKLTADDAAADDRFGIPSIDGDTILIASLFDDDAGASSGSAYVFRRIAGVWRQTQKLTADDAAAGDTFGSAVSVSGGTALVGARMGDGIAANTGAAYLFDDQVSDSPCDINGDGESDPEDAAAFISALLGQPHDPQHVDAADLNGDGAADGADIQPFVDCLLGA